MKLKLLWVFICITALVFSLAGCQDNTSIDRESGDISQTQANTSEAAYEQNSESTAVSKEDTSMKMNVQVGNSIFTATLENNSAVDALVEMMKNEPVTIEMSDYSGFEKVGSLGTKLPSSNTQTTAQPGDIVLYQGNQLVIFYGSNSWQYTRIGKIDDITGWQEALGSGDVTVTFSLGN